MAKTEDYKLPVKNTEEVLRNFKGVQKNQYVKLEDLKDASGTTDTDTKTSPGKDKGTSTIQSKQGKVNSWGGKVLGTKI